MRRFGPGALFLLMVVCCLATVLCGCSDAVLMGGPQAQQRPHGSAHLAVADTFNYRVLIYNAPFTTGMSASVVLGQPDLTHHSLSLTILPQTKWDTSRT